MKYLISLDHKGLARLIRDLETDWPGTTVRFGRVGDPDGILRDYYQVWLSRRQVRRLRNGSGKGRVEADIEARYGKRR